jgi:NDP-sugar pyrophosphorylase family protein
MKAMILAAGLGTRLRPLTNDRPKALVTVAGRALLEIAIRRLQFFGVTEVIVNVYHHADMIVDYLRANDNFGMRVEISREKTLLDTGGGLKNAAAFFLESGDGETLGQPFILHNVDVISNIDLEAMVYFHVQHNALATLAVQHRTSSRLLLFDCENQLVGRRISTNTQEKRDGDELGVTRPHGPTQELAFSGIHVLSSRIFAKMPETGAFSIIDSYLNLAARQQRIVGYQVDGSYWRDLGRPESLAEAENDMANGIY